MFIAAVIAGSALFFTGIFQNKPNRAILGLLIWFWTAIVFGLASF